tara:strand:- start:370 stop:1515 length:1146 start_codon:yes stop_codon:yes gene_type:complete
MAYYSIFPEKDATLYSHPDRFTMNTGNDEILELVKEKGTNDQNYYPTRILIKFKDSDIQNVFETKILNKTGSYSASLELFSAKHENLASNHIIEAFPISESWDEGTGRYSNIPVKSDGCSWLYKDNDTRKNKWPTGSFNENTTGSIQNNLITKGGGTWYNDISFRASQSFDQVKSIDLSVNVTHITSKFSASILGDIQYPNGIPNNGFIIKNDDIGENLISSSRGVLSFFSTDTHTIYPPKLTFKWDDSIHSSQSIAKTNGELNVSLYRNKKEYNQNDEALIRLHVRDKYPTRQFTSSSNYLNSGYFTTSSYYSIRDAHTEEAIIPFDDDFTKLSADDEGMYFKLYMKGLQPERYYRILFKHTNNDGTEIFDDNYHFKVIR